MSRTFRTLLAGTILATSLLGTLIVPKNVTAAGIAITPPRFQMFGNPGDILTEKIKVRNDEDIAITYTTNAEDFKADGDEGNVNLIEGGNDVEKSSFSMARWITVEPRSFTVDAGSERILDVTVRIPRDAEPGGHFATVLIQRGGTPTAGGAAVESRVGTLFLMRVSGDVTENATVDYFKSQESFLQTGPVTLELRTKNDGNVHIAPKGRIVISNTFGQKVAEIPLTTANVLPGAARIVRSTWSDKNLIGRYTATLFADYGTPGTAGSSSKQLSATTTFIVFPLWLLWTILGIILVIVLLITQRKGVKKFINRLTAD